MCRWQLDLRYFDTIITPVACFAAGHRAIFEKNFNTVDVTFGKLLQSVPTCCHRLALEPGAICCQCTSGPLVVSLADMDVEGTSHRSSSTKHLGHYDPEILQVPAFNWRDVAIDAAGGQM